MAKSCDDSEGWPFVIARVQPNKVAVEVFLAAMLITPYLHV